MGCLDELNATSTRIKPHDPACFRRLNLNTVLGRADARYHLSCLRNWQFDTAEQTFLWVLGGYLDVCTLEGIKPSLEQFLTKQPFGRLLLAELQLQVNVKRTARFNPYFPRVIHKFIRANADLHVPSNTLSVRRHNVHSISPWFEDEIRMLLASKQAILWGCINLDAKLKGTVLERLQALLPHWAGAMYPEYPSTACSQGVCDIHVNGSVAATRRIMGKHNNMAFDLSSPHGLLDLVLVHVLFSWGCELQHDLVLVFLHVAIFIARETDKSCSHPDVSFMAHFNSLFPHTRVCVLFSGWQQEFKRLVVPARPLVHFWNRAYDRPNKTWTKPTRHVLDSR